MYDLRYDNYDYLLIIYIKKQFFLVIKKSFQNNIVDILLELHWSFFCIYLYAHTYEHTHTHTIIRIKIK